MLFDPYKLHQQTGPKALRDHTSDLVHTFTHIGPDRIGQK